MAENPIYEQKNITFFISKDTFEKIPNKVTKIIVRYENVYSLPPTPVGSILDIKNNNEPLKYVFFNPDNDKRLDDYQKAENRKVEDNEGDSSDDYDKEIILVNFKNRTGEEISGDSMITLTHPIFLNKITIQNPYKSIGRNETVRLHLRGTIDTENPGNNSVKFPNFQVESNKIDSSIALINLEENDNILEHFTLEDIRKNIIHFENNAALVKDPLASLLDTYKLAKSLGLTTNEYPDVTFAEKEQFFIKNLQRKRIYYEKKRNIEQYINQDNLKEDDKSIIDVNGKEIIHKFDDKYFIYVLNSTMCLPKELKHNEKYGLIYSNFDGNIDRIDVTSKLFNYQKLDNDLIYRLKMTGLNGQESNSNIHVLTLDKLKKINEEVEKWSVYLTTSKTSNTSSNNVEINNKLKMITRNNLTKIHPNILYDNNKKLNVINGGIHGEIKIPDELYWEITWYNPTQVGGEIMMMGGGITSGQKREIYDTMNEILNNIDDVKNKTDDVKNKTDDVKNNTGNGLIKYCENYITKLKKFKEFKNIDRHHKKGAWKGSSIKGLIDLFEKLKKIQEIKEWIEKRKDMWDEQLIKEKTAQNIKKKREILKKIKKKANELKYEFYEKQILDKKKPENNGQTFKKYLIELYNKANENYKNFLLNAKIKFNENMKSRNNSEPLFGINNYGQTYSILFFDKKENLPNNNTIINNAKNFIESQKKLFNENNDLENNDLENNDLESYLNNNRTKEDLFRWILEWTNDENPERKGMDYLKSINITSGNYVDKLLQSLKDLIQEVDKKKPTDIPKKMFNYMNRLNESIYYSDKKDGNEDFNNLIEKFKENLTKFSEKIEEISEDFNKIVETKNNEINKLKDKYHYLFDYENIFRDLATEATAEAAAEAAATTKTTATAKTATATTAATAATAKTTAATTAKTTTAAAAAKTTATALALALAVAQNKNNATKTIG